MRFFCSKHLVQAISLDMEVKRMEKNIESILKKMPMCLQEILEKLPEDIWEGLEELHFRNGQNALIMSAGKEYKLDFFITSKVLEDILNKVLNYSYYAFEYELSQGYVTIEGGHRVGICGKVVMENERIKLIKNVSSVNIRRCRELKGISEIYMDYLLKKDGTLHNILIVSPPKCGKTTLLRDIVRNLSYRGFSIGVCDERSEIAGTYQGSFSFDLGPRTDVLDGCPKDKGMSMLIRSMSPDVIVTDEIGKIEDVKAIESALCAGVSLITTIHGDSYDDILQSGIKELIEKNIFSCILFLGKTPVTGTLKDIRRIEI